MSKAFQLTIPKPCHENWDKMTQAEKGKFCSSCQKQVIDFTSMNDRELAAFFKNPSTGSVCGRFNNDQLNKELEIPRKRIPWLKYFFTIALPAFLASSKAAAQGEVKKIMKSDTTVSSTKRTVTLGNALPRIKCERPDIKKNDEVVGNIEEMVVGQVKQETARLEKVITGLIIDEAGIPVSYSTIRIKGTQHAVAADSSGRFNLKTDIETPTIEISAIGYKTKEQLIDLNKKENSITIEMVQLKRAVLGGLVVTRCYKTIKPLPSIHQIFKDIAFRNFKFYPNPATPGSSITIQWRQPEAGEFEIQMMNQDGQIVKRTIENFVERNNSIQYTISFISAGNYFLVMTNKKSGKRITEKIIIQ